MNRQSLFLCAQALVAASLIGCGGGGASFSPVYPDNRADAVEPVLARLAATSPAPAEPVAAGVTGAPHKLYVVDLQSGQTRWQVDVGTPAHAPIVAGDLVLLHESRGIVAFDLQSGRERFVVEDDAMFLTGAGGEGSTVAFALSTGGGVGARSKLVFVKGGRVVRTRRVDSTLGSPTVAAGMVFVPWATQNLSILDAATGDEIARLRNNETPIGWSGRVGHDVYYGQRGIFRLNTAAATGQLADADFFEPMARDLPGEPTLVTDPYAPTPGADSAIHKIRLDWHPSESGSMAFGDDRLYATFYRLVFGLPPSEEGVHFVYAHSEDIVGAAAVPGGLFIADEAGAFHFIDASGRSRWSAEGSLLPTAVHVRPGTFIPPGATPAAPLAEAELAEQLVSAAQNTDARLVPARRLAIHLMGAIEGENISAQLITVCEDRRAPAPIRDESCRILSSRASGPGPILTALERQHDYLSQSSAAPIGPLATAAATMGVRQAVDPLMTHLWDPHTPEADLKTIATALVALEATSAVERLREWLALYHATARQESMAAALGAVATAILTFEGEDAKAFVQELAEDPLAPEVGRRALYAAIQGWEAAQPPEESEGEEGGEEKGEGEEGAETVEEGPVSHTTLGVAMSALEDVHPRIRACLSNDDGRAQSARVAVTLAGDGTVQAVNVVPARLTSCIRPLIRRGNFPGNVRGAREQLTLTFRR